MVRFLIKTTFGSETFTRGRRLLEAGNYFDLIVKLCGAYLRLNTDKRKCGKAEDAQYR